jgi:hypothetical protein
MAGGKRQEKGSKRGRNGRGLKYETGGKRREARRLETVSQEARER